MKPILSISVLSLAIAAPAMAAPITLYDGSIDTDPVQPGVQSSLPDAQSWLQFVSPVSNTQYVSPGSGYTSIDTTSGGDAGGAAYANGHTDVQIDENFNFSYYMEPFNPAFPTLNESDGFTLSLSGKMLAETHASTSDNLANDLNAGLSLTVVTSDKHVVAIGFRGDKIFNQMRNEDSDSYREANLTDVTYSTQVPDTFELHVQGGQFTLSMNGTPLFSDSTFVAAPSSFNPQFLAPNLITLGDFSDTANVNFQFNSLTFATAVPEPFGLSLLLLGGMALMMRRPRRRA